ncbi:hypothetical protein Tco_0917788 [Tanacetum coccineum]
MLSETLSVVRLEDSHGPNDAMYKPLPATQKHHSEIIHNEDGNPARVNIKQAHGSKHVHSFMNSNCDNLKINEGRSYTDPKVLYDHVMNPLIAHQERKTRKDHGTRRGRHSTSSSSAIDQPSSSHLIDDYDVNGEGTSRASTPSPIRFVNSLTNDVP